jgi:hypothetical protein
MLGQRSGENCHEVVDVQLEGFKIGHHQLHTRHPYQSSWSEKVSILTGEASEIKILLFFVR